MSDIVKVNCPVCKTVTNAERKSKYFHQMGTMMWFVHAIMLLITAAVWIGWMLGSWYFDGKTNVCYECNEEVDNEHIV